MPRDPLADVRASLRASGCRVTRPRLAVARVLLEAQDTLEPEEILERAAELHPNLGLVTVYRTLALLTKLGHVRRIHEPGGCYGYSSASMDHSHHVVCRVCREAVEFPGTEQLRPLINSVARKTGFVIEDHLLELMGVCPDCQERID